MVIKKNNHFQFIFQKKKNKNHLNLLLITEDEKNHYVLIKDFNKFMYNQTKHKDKKHFCMYCLQNFTTEKILKNHSEICMVFNGKQAIRMPDKDNNKLEFKNSHKEIPVPFVIYADFEAITEKVHGCQNDNDKSFTEDYQKHIDRSYAYKLVCCYNDQYSRPIKIYRGPDAVNKFMKAILKESKRCQKILKTLFNKEKLKEISKKQPVIFHNLRGYDSHLLCNKSVKLLRIIHTKTKEVKCVRRISMLSIIICENIWLLCSVNI